MPMGIVSDSDFLSQLDNVSPSNRQEKFIPPVPLETDINQSLYQIRVPSSDTPKDAPASNESQALDPEVLPYDGPVIEVDAPVVDGTVVPFKMRGRGIGSKEVPESLRKLIAGTAAIEGREAALQLGRDFGLSDASVSAYTKGATSTASYHQPDKDIIAYVKQRKGRVTKKALRVMQNSLDQLTPEKIAQAKAKDIAGIARDMSTIIGNMSDSVVEQSDHSGPTFVLYSPPVIPESQFKAIPSVE